MASLVASSWLSASTSGSGRQNEELGEVTRWWRISQRGFA